MLVLTRGRGERTFLYTTDGKIEIQVVDVLRHGRVRLGIVAPETVTILRDDAKNPFKPLTNEVPPG